MRRFATILVLVCATTSCVLSIFYVNTSYLDLSRFANGTERQPFQRRILLVPFVRWAQSNSLLQRLALRFGQNIPQPEPMTAAKLGCVILGILMLAVFGYWTTLVAERLSIRNRWLVWAIILVILYVSYGARYEQTLWYPYDIPHLVLFGIASTFILTDQPLAFVPALLVDAFARETSLYLIVLAVAVHQKSRKWLITAAASLSVWVVAHIIAIHLYPTGAHEWNGLRWYAMLKPWHLPQLLSIVGYMWFPVWLSWGRFAGKERRALLSATTLMLLTFPFATWNETRVWSEWTALFAVLSAIAIERSLVVVQQATRAEESMY